MTQLDFYTLLPLVVLVVWASLLLIADLFIPKDKKGWTASLSALGLALTLGLTFAQIGRSGMGFQGMVALDNFAIFVNALLLISALLALALSYGYIKRRGIERGEYYTLTLFSVAGMMLMAQAADLIMVFLALEMLSLPLYVLAAFARPREDSEEAGLKYFLLGAFAAGFLIYGIALVYGATQTTALQGIVDALSAGTASMPLLAAGAGLILVGLGFKVAAVPFHMWTPDVYQGAPSSVTAFMAAGAKIAGFAALMRVFSLAFPSLSDKITPILWVLAALTMILGNLVAIAQTNIKRMLAYSSIAHAGYILMALTAMGNEAVRATAVAAALFYLAAYALTNYGAWSVVAALEDADGSGLELDDYAGLGRKYPLLAAAMTVFMLSFTGIPPTLGLVGKFYLFRAALEAGFVWLAVIGVLTSLISAYYYLRVVVIMYMREGQPKTWQDDWQNLVTSTTAVLTVVLSLVPAIVFALVANAGF